MEVHKLIIIGSWPAWHTAWIYAAKALLHPLLFEWFMAWGIAAGGQLTTTTIVENFPWFPEGIKWVELMDHMRQQSINAWVDILTKTVDSVDLSKRPFKVVAGNEEYFAESLIIATGATAKRMNLPWEPRYWQRGISACAVCDWGLPLFRNKKLLVVWWWDAALEEALYLTRFASEVVLLVRRDVFRASKAMQAKVENNDKISVLWNTEAQEALWDGKVLTHVRVKNNKTGETFDIECWGLFYAIGHRPNTEFLNGQVDIDDSWYIITEKGSTKTSVEGVFAAWDVQDKVFRQAVTSAWTGCMAAMEAEKFLEQ